MKELIYNLEKMFWECIVERNWDVYEKIVSPNVILIRAGKRYFGRDFFDQVEIEKGLSHELLQYEIVANGNDAVQVHYLIKITGTEDTDPRLVGTFHVTSTWARNNDSFWLIFNMDSKTNDNEEN